MLSILVLAFATSALAAPGVMNVNLLDSNNGYSEGSAIASFLGLYDSGDGILNGLNMVAVLKDLSNSGGNQASTNGQAVAILGEASTGKVGDACAAANYINAYTRYVQSGNSAGVRKALSGFIQSLSTRIDNIVGYVNNKEAARYATGPRGGCPNEGRVYQFEPAWDVILGIAPNNQVSLVNEEYCVAKRMYCGFNARANNVAAVITASALPPSVQVFERASGPLSNFIQCAGSRSNNLVSAAAALKQALSYGISSVKL